MGDYEIPERIAGRAIDGSPAQLDVARLTWRPSAYGLIFDDKGRVLVLDNTKNGKHEFPGGGVEIWETLREAVVLILRDVAQLVDYGRETVSANWDMLSDMLALMSREMRRKLGLEEMTEMHRRANDLREKAKSFIPKEKSENISGKDVNNERHIQDSNISLYESESSKEMEEAAAGSPRPCTHRVCRAL